MNYLLSSKLFSIKIIQIVQLFYYNCTICIIIRIFTGRISNRKKKWCMKVKILEVSTDELTGAVIRKGEEGELPSIQDEWRFNFAKQLKQLAHATAYVLVAEDTPKQIEGCIIFQMKDKVVPVMAFLEIAPHNKGDKRKYDYVAGCLIAFAFKQTYIKGKKDYKGYLLFEVLEKDPVDTEKLMKMYSTKYNAKKFDHTTMIIIDEAGDKLIERYLPS